MRIIYSKDYKKLSNIRHYPFAGYWYSVAELQLPIHITTYPEFYNNNFVSEFTSREDWLTRDDEENPGFLHKTNTYMPSVSQLHKAKVLLDNDTAYLSITLPDSLRNKSIAMVFLYAIDLIEYPDGNVVDDGYTDQVNYVLDAKNISCILANPVSTDTNLLLINKTTNIIDLKYNPRCSFRNSLLYGANQDEVTHYVHGEVDRGTLFETLLTANKFIESVSGFERARALIGTDDPGQLLGHMTIGTNGVIHL